MNVKKGIKNIIASALSQGVSLLLGIIIPRLVLVNLGSEANGLLNTISNVLVYVALLEAGVGDASRQAMYGPVGRQNYADINAVLAATDHFYKRTGRWYLAVILLLTFVFPLSLDSSMPRWHIMAVMFLSGMPGVIKYYYQGKFNILLRTEGKGYILTNISTIIHVATSLSKIVLLLAGADIVELQIMYMCFNLLQVGALALYIRRHYPWIDLKVKPNFGAISQSKNALVHQVSSLIFYNTDSLLLTYFCGLKAVSVYSIYTMLFGVIISALGYISSFEFILGQNFHTNRKRYLKLVDTYEILHMTLAFCLLCIANIFINPFVALYTAGVSDINYIDKYLPYLMIATYLLSNGRASSSLTITFAGHFRQTQNHSIYEAIINIVVSLLGVWQFGIYGVLLGTIAALLYRTNIMILYANRKILGRSAWITYRRWLLNLALFIVVTVVGKWFFSFVALDSYFRIIGWAVVTCIVVIPFFFGVVSLCEGEVFRFAWELLKPYLMKMKEKYRKKE